MGWGQNEPSTPATVLDLSASRWSVTINPRKLFCPMSRLIRATVWPVTGTSPAARTALGVTAVAVSGLGAPLALGLAAALGRDEDGEESPPVDCPHCGTLLLLDAAELQQGWYLCPDCHRTALILDSVTCPHCQAELELSDDELARQAFECPECGHHVTMA